MLCLGTPSRREETVPTVLRLVFPDWRTARRACITRINPPSIHAPYFLFMRTDAWLIYTFGLVVKTPKTCLSQFLNPLARTLQTRPSSTQSQQKHCAWAPGFPSLALILVIVTSSRGHSVADPMRKLHNLVMRQCSSGERITQGLLSCLLPSLPLCSIAKRCSFSTA